jgi:NADH:ubiquinone oxidoreductase subunit F (NADH-binding)
VAKGGLLSRTALEEVAASLQTPLADLYSAASFYHYFKLDGDEPLGEGVCRGPVCSLSGIAPRAHLDLPSISCPGLCDQAPARYDRGDFSSAASADGGFRLPHRTKEEEALFRHIRAPDRRLESCRRNDGYGMLLNLVQKESDDEALATLQASGLCGRGGAAFPLALKWRAVRDAEGSPKYVVCNADEGEPGTFKDRPILHLQPHLLLEAMAIAGYLVGANVGIIYLRYEYPRAYDVLAKAIGEAEEEGLLGSNVGGSSFCFQVHIRRGAGSYVCGEESALLNSLEGRRPWPRERPPYPTSRGLWGRPTVVNNVETLCFVPLILRHGADWFRSLGRGGSSGTKIYSVSGRVCRPGNFELPVGISARELIMDYAGGPPSGRSLKAFTLGGISGGLLASEHLSLSLDYRSPAKHGVFLGSGGVIVLDDRCCVVDFVRSCVLFYEAESCGKCTPCRIGTVRLRELLDGLTGRGNLPSGVRQQMEKISDTMGASSACGLGQSVPLVVSGMGRFFAEELREHTQRKCRAGVCPL